VLREVAPYEELAIESALDAEVDRGRWNKRAFYMPIRVAISAKSKTPPLFPMLAALGWTRTERRLRDALQLIGAEA